MSKADLLRAEAKRIVNAAFGDNMNTEQPTPPPVVLSTAMLNVVRSHQPNGGMCASCAWARRNCGGLKFEAMPVIGTDDGTGAKIVRCTEYLSGNPEKKTDFLAAAMRAT